MVKRLQNPRAAKIHLCYKVDEVADLYSVGKGTVHNWIKSGLKICDDKKPILIRGLDLNEFHANRRQKDKRPCREDEIYCMRCKLPRKPTFGLVEYKPINEKTGDLISICPVCKALMFRRVSNSKLRQFTEVMGINSR